MANIVVFCSSSDNISPMFNSEMEVVAKGLAEAGHNIIYGGACVGPMGVLARTALKHGAEVHGIIPEYFNKPGIAQEGLTSLLQVDNMLDRKLRMLEMSDGVVVFPGGIGTLDEALEAMSLKMVKEWDGPIYMHNFLDFWTPFMSYLDELHQQRMIGSPLKEIYQVSSDSEELVRGISRDTKS